MARKQVEVEMVEQVEPIQDQNTLAAFTLEIGSQIRFRRETATGPIFVEPGQHGATVVYGDSRTVCPFEVVDYVLERLARHAGGWL